MIRTLLIAGILLAWLFGAQGVAAYNVEEYDNCSRFKDADERLKCYEGVAGRKPKASELSPAPVSAYAPQAVATGDLAWCIIECEGEKEKCDAERLRCYDDKAKYSWSTCITSSIVWKQKSPEILNACKYFFEDAERLYGYDKLAGFKATTDAARVATGDLAKCSVACKKGEEKECDAERLRCYDGKAEYSWPKCMGGNYSWIQERPERLNACKYFFEDPERLYGYDELAGYKPPQPVSSAKDTEQLNVCDEITGLKPTTPEERYRPSYLSIKWRLNEDIRQIDEKRRQKHYVESRLMLEEKLQQLKKENGELFAICRQELEKKISQLNEENSQALAEENRMGRLALAYQQNYILFGTYNFHPDKQLWESANPGMELQDYEAKFQLSLKLKLFDITDNSVTGDWERHLGTHIDVWLAYTQLSFWQIYNASISRPFRETNYEPELILNGQMDKDLFYDWKLRFIQIALNHQSNGQIEALSRSWNRLMFNFGFERENFDVVLKTWYRFPESTNDDNPDIESYLGYGQLSAGYRSNLLGIDWRFSLMFRNNLRFDENRSALQLELSFPLVERINGYVQYFTGYGESLINYNSYANTIGAGVSVKDW
jgi:phospholipase A1